MEQDITPEDLFNMFFGGGGGMGGMNGGFGGGGPSEITPVGRLLLDVRLTLVAQCLQPLSVPVLPFTHSEAKALARAQEQVVKEAPNRQKSHQHGSSCFPSSSLWASPSLPLYRHCSGLAQHPTLNSPSVLALPTPRCGIPLVSMYHTTSIKLHGKSTRFTKAYPRQNAQIPRPAGSATICADSSRLWSRDT